MTTRAKPARRLPFAVQKLVATMTKDNARDRSASAAALRGSRISLRMRRVDARRKRDRTRVRRRAAGYFARKKMAALASMKATEAAWGWRPQSRAAGLVTKRAPTVRAVKRTCTETSAACFRRPFFCFFAPQRAPHFTPGAGKPSCCRRLLEPKRRSAIHIQEGYEAGSPLGLRRWFLAGLPALGAASGMPGDRARSCADARSSSARAVDGEPPVQRLKA
jgi:hypothetical protein